MRPFFVLLARELQPVHQDVEAQPHHVHKVPIPRSTFETEVLVGSEMAFLQTKGNDQQHQHTQEHMESVETCEHEEGRAINARREFEVHLAIRMAVLVALHQQKDNP